VAGALFAFGYVLTRRDRPGFRDLLFAASGFLLPFIVEFLLFWSNTGDPLWRRRLDLHHTLIPSSELRSHVNPSRGPLFNTSNIAGWKPAAGIHVHWAVDGILNLLASAQSGVSLLLTPLLALVARKEADGVARRTIRLWLIALGYASVLIYVLAIDPKPRLMFAPLAMANLGLALLCCRMFRHKPALVLASCFAVAAMCVALLYAYPSDLMIERSAKVWISEHHGEIETDENTRRHLTLVAAAAALPRADGQRPYLLYRAAEACDRWISNNGLHGVFSLVRQSPVSRVGWVNARVGALCLLHYDRRVPATAIREALRRSDLANGGDI
jgi:hypothetical protein